MNDQPLHASSSLLNNGWNENIEKDLRSLQLKAVVYSQIHEIAAERNKRDNLIYKLSMFIITAISTIFGYLASSVGAENPWSPFSIVTNVSNSILVVMVGMNTLLNYGGESEQHRSAVREYNRLDRQIDQQLTTDPEYRIVGHEAQAKFKQSDIKIQDAAPSISKYQSTWRENVPEDAPDDLKGFQFGRISAKIEPTPAAPAAPPEPAAPPADIPLIVIQEPDPADREKMEELLKAARAYKKSG